MLKKKIQVSRERKLDLERFVNEQEISLSSCKKKNGKRRDFAAAAVIIHQVNQTRRVVD